jgi:hypothetical protein
MLPVFIYVLSGVLVLIENEEAPLGPTDARGLRGRAQPGEPFRGRGTGAGRRVLHYPGP